MLPVLTVLALALSMVAVQPPDRAPRQAARSPQAAPPPPPAPLVPPVLVAHQDAAGRASSLTVLAPGPDGRGGSLVLLPPGTMAEVVSLGLEPVGQSLELGGPSRLQSTVENLLGVGLGGVVVASDAAMAELLAPAGPLRVEVPERVEQVAPTGVVDVVYEAGPATVAPLAAGRFLATKGRGSDLSRLVRHQAFWETWLDVLRQRPAATPSRPPELASALRALAAGPVQARVVPVEGFGSAGGAGELYRVRKDELARMVASVFPTASRQGQVERPRVQVLNGTGALGTAEAVRAKLGARFDVRLTGNAARFDHQRTEVVFYDRAEEGVADDVRKALGVGTLVLSRRPLDVVDVTVVVGRDFQP